MQKKVCRKLLYVENALKTLKGLYVEEGIVARNLPSNSEKDCMQKNSNRTVVQIILCRNLQGLYVEKF